MVLCFAGYRWSHMVGGSTWRFDFTDNNQLLTAIFKSRNKNVMGVKGRSTWNSMHYINKSGNLSAYIVWRHIWDTSSPLLSWNVLRPSSSAFHYLPPGGTPLYKPHRYVLPQRVEVLRFSSLITGIDFAHLGLKSDSFRRKEGVYERMYRFNINWIREKRRMRIRNGF